MTANFNQLKFKMRKLQFLKSKCSKTLKIRRFTLEFLEIGILCILLRLNHS